MHCSRDNLSAAVPAKSDNAMVFRLRSRPVRRTAPQWCLCTESRQHIKANVGEKDGACMRRVLFASSCGKAGWVKVSCLDAKLL